MRLTRTTSNLAASAVSCFALSVLVHTNSINRAMCTIDLTKPLRSPIWQVMDDALIVVGILLLGLAFVSSTRHAPIETIDLC